MSGLIIATVLLFAPAIFHNSLLLDYRPWTFLVFLSVILFTHPKMDFRKLGADRKSDQDKFSLILINLSAYLSFLPVYFYYLRSIYEPSLNIQISWIEILAIGMGLFGVLFRWKSIRMLGQWFTSEVVTDPKQSLIQDGPYKYIRHPSYTGALLFWNSAPLLFRCPKLLLWTLPILLTAYFWRIHVEEKALTDQFQDIYRNYQKSSKKLIPYIY